VTTTPQDGSAYVRLTVASGAGVELLAYHDITSIDLSSYDSIGFWIRVDTGASAGVLAFVLDNTAACASPLETITLPPISPGTWTWVNLNFVTPANLTAVVSIGIKQLSDNGAMVVDIDQIVVGDWADQIGVGDYFKIGSTGIHTGATWYEVLTVDSDTQITLTAVYAGSSADQQTYAIRQIFTGGNTDFWDVTKFTDSSLGDIFVATNGVDTPVYGTGNTAVVAITGLPSTMKAKYVISVYQRILFAWTVEGGANQPERWRLSAVGNANSYTTSEFGDEIDDGSGITGVAKHGDYIILTKEKKFYIGRFVGGTYIIDFELASAPVGCKSHRSMVIDKEWLYYYGYDKKFHRWNLVTDQVISESVFDETKNFDPNLENYIVGDNVYPRNQIRWLCPLNTVDYNNHVFVFDYKNESMNIWTCGAEQALQSIGFYLLQDDLYLDDATWGEYYLDEQDGYFDDVNALSNAPVYIYGGYDGYVRIVDTTATDDGTAYTRTLRLKRLNFNLPEIKKRLWKQQWWFEQESGGSVSLSMYKDDSNSASAVAVLSLTNANKDIVKITATIDLNGENFQPELQATAFFALIGVMNYFFEKRRSF